MNRVREYKASLFQALAHPTRLEILEALRPGELSVGGILARVGRDQANVSQHLATLRARGLVTHRKEGNQVIYAVRDPLLFDVLDGMRRFATAHAGEMAAALAELRADSEATS